MSGELGYLAGLRKKAEDARDAYLKHAAVPDEPPSQWTEEYLAESEELFERMCEANNEYKNAGGGHDD